MFETVKNEGGGQALPCGISSMELEVVEKQTGIMMGVEVGPGVL